MLYYAKITAANPKDRALALFSASGATEEEIILDASTVQKTQECIYEWLKRSLKNQPTTLTIDSLNSLGKNNREIAKELQWFYDNQIHLVVLDVPTTIHKEASPLKVLTELYKNLAAKEIQNVKENQKLGIERSKVENKPLGRKKIPYPPNWEKLYQQWENKQITPDEFMAATGLKKGTLYNLIKQYKATMVISKQA